MPWVRLDGVVSLGCASGGAVLVPAAGEGQWGQHSGGQGRAELAQKGCWELRAGLCLWVCTDADGSISVRVPGAGIFVQAFLPAGRPDGVGMDGCSHVARLAGVATVPVGALCSELGTDGRGCLARGRPDGRVRALSRVGAECAAWMHLEAPPLVVGMLWVPAAPSLP